MTIFYLPDLGEGLAEAIVHEWHVKLNDEIKTDQTMVSVETAKAVVDIPSPFSGKILKLFAKPGDTIKIGEPLIEVETDSQTATVAGKLETSNIILEEENFDIDTEIKKESHWLDHAEKLSGIRLSMAQNMKKAQQEVVHASIFDDADVSHFTEKTDITATVIQALCKACKAEPTLNAWYDSKKQKKLLHSAVHLGLAVDTPQGLLVPVIKEADKKSPQELREVINTYKKGSLPPDTFQGATIMLSNIGTMAGRFATPIIMPPTVAIIATGKIDPATKKLPLSLSFDHQVVTGGEASRFLGVMLKALATNVISK
jgi:2-oxoisovalerate dehydrogenase E2 component (dihydrolipoyl transacylase)